MSGDADVVLIGAGQAGLAVSCRLSAAAVPHVVLERGRIGETWRRRWDSFCLITPNWTLQLPGHSYDGDDEDGSMSRDEVVAYPERYASACAVPVREGVEVASLARGPDGAFTLTTSDGPLTARTVVVATGAYQRPHRPPTAATLPASVQQLDVEEYRGSVRTTDRGSTARARSTTSGSRCTTKARAAPRAVSTSSASTSCASASRRSSAAWARTPRSSRARSRGLAEAGAGERAALRCD